MLTLQTDGTTDTFWFQPRWPIERVRGFFSCRVGGVSQTPYASLNVGLHVSDCGDDVVKNRILCSQVMDCNLDEWVVAEQVHGSDIAIIDASHRGMGAYHHETSVQGVDALITNVPELTLVVMAADCVPILFCDSVKQVVAVAHSGWKGTIQHIGRRVVEEMIARFDCDANDIICVLGPSIRRCCYEVDDRVATQVHQAFSERFAIPCFNRPGKYMLSLQACIHADLRAAGVLEEHIEDAGICTACRTDLVYSHRKESGRTGRHLGAVRIVPTP